MLKQSFYSVPTRFQRQSKIMQRRSFIIGAATLTALTVAGPVRSLEGKTKMNNLEKWDKTFPQDDRVEHKKVSFYTRFGTRLIGNLYCPKGVSGDLPAIAVCGPFGAVKEQASGLYAQTLAANGFVTLAFDPSFTGESSGFPRNLASPDISTEDFSAAVDYLSNLKGVDHNKIGVLGICGFGGFALNAAAIDTRIKATVTSTMYDMSRVNTYGYFDKMDKNARYALKQELNAQRTEDTKDGTYAPGAGLPDKLTGDEPQFVKDYWEYYKTPRGFHPRSINSNGHWNKTSALSFINTPLLTFADEIRSPVLMIHGEKAHSLYFSKDAFKKLTGDNKTLMIIPAANHTDLYDNMKYIPMRVSLRRKTCCFSCSRLFQITRNNIHFCRRTSGGLGLSHGNLSKSFFASFNVLRIAAPLKHFANKRTVLLEVLFSEIQGQFIQEQAAGSVSRGNTGQVRGHIGENDVDLLPFQEIG